MREKKALIKANDELKCGDMLMITWDYEAEEEFKGKRIKFTPLWKWLLVLVSFLYPRINKDPCRDRN
jgi:predicted AAA+ superfamily ATPase